MNLHTTTRRSCANSTRRRSCLRSLWPARQTTVAFSIANAIDQSAIREAVVADWGPLLLTSSNPTVTVNLTREPAPPALSSAQAYDAVQIQVSYNLPPLMSWPGIPSIPLMRSSTTMRIQP